MCVCVCESVSECALIKLRREKEKGQWPAVLSAVMADKWKTSRQKGF